MATPSPLEKEIQAKIIRWLRKRPGSFTWKMQAGPYAIAGLPDVMHIEAGILYAIEVKRPGRQPTPLQSQTIGKLNDAGAVSFVATSIEDIEQILSAHRAG